MNRAIYMGFLLGMILSNVSIASETEMNLTQIRQSCISLKKGLIDIAQLYRTDPCYGDVINAAQYFDMAASEIQEDNMRAAIPSIAYGKNELKAIAQYRSYCKHFSKAVLHYIELNQMPWNVLVEEHKNSVFDKERLHAV